jgi:UDP-N-acetylmuramoyl-L-alanyl-D-glutamate--2,6-diaminopimelate ligase
MMKLKQLFKTISHTVISGDSELEISGIAYDSRAVKHGYLFVAMKGELSDGNDFISAALENGATAIASEHLPTKELSESGWVQLANPRQALAEIGGNFHNHPDRNLLLTGITGTNGKTTSAHLLQAIFAQAIGKTGMIGTIQHDTGGANIAASLTTPESLDSLAMLRQMADSGCQAAVMEVSSVAADRDRVHRFSFAAMLFTNLSRDHLDYHGDMETYYQAKRSLFSDPASKTIGIINIDDEYGKRLAQESNLKSFTFGSSMDADLRLLSAEATWNGTTLQLDFRGQQQTISSQLLGDFNIENILAASATALALGIDLPAIAAAIQTVAPVRGRMEPVPNKHGINVIVDFAHTDGGLLKLLQSARQLSDGRIITVFGCGGDRDRGKRPLMGKHAFELSDAAIITSDNPRTEDPLQIIEEVKAGKEIANPCRAVIISLPLRKEAIIAGIDLARAGDTVLIAGKGHEDYQIIGTTKSAFDDREVALKALEAK